MSAPRSGAGPRPDARSRPRLVRAFGDVALLAEVGSGAEARALAATVAAARPAGVLDAVVGLRSVLVTLDPARADFDTVGRWLADLVVAPGPGLDPEPHGRARRVEVPVVFGGPDTEEVCRLAGVGPGELASLLCSVDLTVATVGFSPGFAYLEGVPAPLERVPRLDHPRSVVPAGSVALAGGLAAVYPQGTPGGWRLVGWSPMVLFDPSVPPYALLRPGDTVRMVPHPDSPGGVAAPAAAPPSTQAVSASLGSVSPTTVSPTTVSPTTVSPGTWSGRQLAAVPRPPRSVEGAALVVERPGVMAMVQDSGRVGSVGIGVPAAGPADPLSHALANRLVGNHPDAPAVEVTAGGLALGARRPCYVAVVGGDPVVAVDGWEVGGGHVVPLAAGQRLVVERLLRGLRSYLAVAGSVVVPEVLGSASTDVLTWLGPGPLVAGDELAVGHRRGPMADHLAPPMMAMLAGREVVLGASAGAGADGGASAWRGPGPVRAPGSDQDPSVRHWRVRVVAGPHAEWFPGDALERLGAAAFVVTPSSDRVGLRLRPADGGEGLVRRGGELRSQGMVTGAIQVPPDGMPVVLGPDHATLGGYPVVAVAIAADRWMLGQCRPGDEVTLPVVTADEARHALSVAARQSAGALAGTYPVATG